MCANDPFWFEGRGEVDVCVWGGLNQALALFWGGEGARARHECPLTHLTVEPSLTQTTAAGQQPRPCTLWHGNAGNPRGDAQPTG